MMSQNDEATETPNVEHQEPSIISKLDFAPTTGVFALPEQHHEHDDRPGAVATSWTQTDHLQSEHETDLPMIVWLRGDEPWYPEFDLDADAVMDRLGIKRSRLTQISGKDLRVGRVRIDRYIRPMYRTVDVVAYSQWTRATASHQKSSSAIKEAVDALQNQSAQIAQAVEAANTSFKQAIDAGLADKLRDAAVESFDPLLKRIEAFEQTANHLLISMHSEIYRLESTLQERLDRYQSLNGTQWTSADIRMEAIETATATMSLRLAESSEKTERILSHQLTLETYLKVNAEAMQTLTKTLEQAAQSRKDRNFRPKAQKNFGKAERRNADLSDRSKLGTGHRKPAKLRSMRGR